VALSATSGSALSWRTDRVFAIFLIKQWFSVPSLQTLYLSCFKINPDLKTTQLSSAVVQIFKSLKMRHEKEILLFKTRVIILLQSFNRLAR
jgi:hypothetical protein